MKQRQVPQSPNVVVTKDNNNSQDCGYLSWSNASEQKTAFDAVGVSDSQFVSRSIGSDIFMNIAPNGLSARDGFDRRDYEAFRAGESIPTKSKDIIRECMNSYKKVGIIRNIIDLMADFTVKGISISHPNKKIENFYNEWFRRINGVERSERFANLFYRAGNVVVHRQTAKLKAKDEEEFKNAQASPDLEIPKMPTMEKREIPWRYSFINPLTVDVLGEEFIPFIGPDSYQFSILLPDALIKKARSSRTNAAEQALINGLPDNIKKIVKAGGKSIPLDPDKTVCFYYKKDDWQVWSEPMVYPILSDLKMLQKMKLTDLAAIDGAMSCIRVWKLGNLDAQIIPNAATVNRFASMLANNVGGGVMDVVWTPDIELLETKTDVHKFLGDAKYGPVLNAIFQGLGIPPTLTGNASPGGFTNNFISLKTLTERLEYGRSALIQFWNYEIKLVQQAMGFRFPAILTFDNLLTDEAAEKQILLNMWDRGLISDEYVRDVIGAVNNIETMRISRENKNRKGGKLPPKASPFHNPQTEDAILKIFAQSGAYSPDQFGIDIPESTGQHSTPIDENTKMQKAIQKAKPPTVVSKGQPGQGRPLNKKDSSKRKQKTVKPRSKANSEGFIQNYSVAQELQNSIASILTPIYLKSINKKNCRELTNAQTKDFENLKFYVLCQYDMFDTVTEDSVIAKLNTELQVPDSVTDLLAATISEYAANTGKEPTLEILRRFQAGAYALYRGEYDQSEES